MAKALRGGECQETYGVLFVAHHTVLSLKPTALLPCSKGLVPSESLRQLDAEDLVANLLQALLALGLGSCASGSLLEAWL